MLASLFANVVDILLNLVDVGLCWFVGLILYWLVDCGCLVVQVAVRLVCFVVGSS